LDHVFDFPAYVMNLPHRRDRRRHSERLLRSLGFANLTFPRTTRASDLNLPALLKRGEISPQAILRTSEYSGAVSLRCYLALATDYIRVVAEAADSGARLLAVFEDDLTAGACPEVVNRRIAAAIETLPPTADLLFLEACFEYCWRLRYSKGRPGLALAQKPSCSGAVIFTAKGMRNFLMYSRPVFSGVDVMLPELVWKVMVEAFLALPGILFQDGFWGSDSSRGVKKLPFQVMFRGRLAVLVCTYDHMFDIVFAGRTRRFF
jgi:hypothetical protein